MMTEQTAVFVRWMIRADLPEVLEIERGSFEQAWSEDDFIRAQRQRNCIGMVAERQGHIVGFMVYQLCKVRLHLLNFAVAPACRRQKVATRMIDKLKRKLSPQRRQRILLELRESNLPAQLFFRAQGFRAISVLRDFYEDTHESAYVMQYKVPDVREE